MSFCEFQPITPSSKHHVFFELPLQGEEPPHPSKSGTHQQHRDGIHVEMPHSKANTEPISKRKVWDIVSETLKTPPRDFEGFRSAILAYNPIPENQNSFSGFQEYLQDISADEREHFFKSLLPKIISLALQLPKEITKPLPLLRRGVPMSLSLSQKQIGVLLANAFLCTFPPRPTAGLTCGCGEYPDINFNRLFNQHDPHSKEKFKCFFNYFERITSEEPYGVVTFTRSIPELFDFEACDQPLPDLKLELDGVIESAENHLHVDFADKYIGGMIFTKGCVQEEIRFLICPELIVTRLFTAVLDDNEALIITGAEQYNVSAGYSRKFRFVSSFEDKTPRDQFRRRKSQLTAIDALNFNRKTDKQYEPEYIKRELRKAYAGFLPEEGTEKPFTPVATGNWGCGIFRGTPYLKSLIQLIAAGAADRNVTYFAFGEKHLVKDLQRLYQILKSKSVTVGSLTKLLLSYHKVGGKLSGKGLYKYIEEHVP